MEWKKKPQFLEMYYEKVYWDAESCDWYQNPTLALYNHKGGSIGVFELVQAVMKWKAGSTLKSSSVQNQGPKSNFLHLDDHLKVFAKQVINMSVFTLTLSPSVVMAELKSCLDLALASIPSASIPSDLITSGQH